MPSGEVAQVMLDWKHKALIGVVIVLLTGGVLGLRTWLSEHDQRVRAEEQSKAQAAVQGQAQSAIAALQKEMAARDAQYQSALKTLDTKFSRAATPDQLAQLVSQLMGLKQPIQVVTPAPSGSSVHPEPEARVPGSDFPQAKAYFEECEQCKADRAKLQADAADRQSQMDLAQKQIEALKADRDNWEKVAKGGSWMQRVAKGAKWLVLGAAGGAVALCVTGHCR